MIEVPVLIVGGGPVGLTASLLAAPKGDAWNDAARSLGARLPLDTYTIGRELGDPDGAWCTTDGVDDDGAVLVDPVRTFRAADAAMPG